MSVLRPLRLARGNVTLAADRTVLDILWKFGGFLLATAFRFVPRHSRFRAALAVAHALEPLIRRSPAYAIRAEMRADGLPEITLDLVLMMLTRHGVLYEPDITIVGEQLLPRPGDTRPTLMPAAHTMLGKLLVRKIVDSGLDPAIISAEPFGLAGTRRAARVLLPSQMLFVKVREIFKSRGIVMASIDRADAERRSRSIETSRGRFVISLPLLHLALRYNARIVFLTARVSETRKVVVTLVEPSRTRETAVEDVLEDFARFIDAHVHAQSTERTRSAATGADTIAHT